MGATTIYNWYILPNMAQYEKHIQALEKQAADIADAAKDKVGNVVGGSDEKKED